LEKFTAGTVSFDGMFGPMEDKDAEDEKNSSEDNCSEDYVKIMTAKVDTGDYELDDGDYNGENGEFFDDAKEFDAFFCIGDFRGRFDGNRV